MATVVVIERPSVSPDACGSGRRPRADLAKESRESLKKPVCIGDGVCYTPRSVRHGRRENAASEHTFMSQHSSLRAAAATGGKRNVLKRFERVAVLKTRNQWKEGDRITGLRKTKPPE